MNKFPQLDAFRGGEGVVRLVGHRGARGVMPENTMEGFEFTVGIGVAALEFDVLLSRDRIPVITHNHRLLAAATRQADGAWLQGAEPEVSNMTLAELQTLDVGGLDGRTIYGQRFPDQAFMNGVRIPRLDDLLNLAARPGNENIRLLLELKSDPQLHEDTQERREVVQTVVAEVRARNLAPQTVLHSFDWALMDECRNQAPEMPTSYLSQLPSSANEPGEESSKSVEPDFDAMPVSLPRAVKAAGGQMWCPYFADVTPELVAEARELGLIVTTWTANEPADIDLMIDAGVDGIVTDYPGRVQHRLLSRGLRWIDRA